MLIVKNSFWVGIIVCVIGIGYVLIQLIPSNNPVNKQQASSTSTVSLTSPSAALSLPKKSSNSSDHLRISQLETLSTQTNRQLQTILSQQVALQQQQGTLLAMLEQLKNTRQTSTSYADNNDSEVPITPKSDEKIAEETLVYLDQQLLDQIFDATWSGEATEAYDAMMQNEALSGTTLQETECKSTFCRTAFTHADALAMEHFNEHFDTAITGNTTTYFDIVNHADGSITTIAYVSRDGYDLPFNSGSEEK
jgi:hypothetical protein